MTNKQGPPTTLQQAINTFEKRLPGERRTAWLNRIWAMRIYVALGNSEVLKARKARNDSI